MTNPLFDHLIAPHRGSDTTFATTPAGPAGYGAFHAAICRAANVLFETGLGPGDRLALQVEKSLDALVIYGACMATGLIFVPLNPGYTPDEVAYFIGDATPRLVICDPARIHQIGPFAAEHGAKLLTLDAAGGGSFAEATAEMPGTFVPMPRRPDDLATFLYTSGTTGRSKGAMLTHDNLLSNARALVEAWRITERDVLLHALPIFHTHGLLVAINTTLLSGAGMIYLPRFNVDEVMKALPRVTTMMGVPTFYTRMLNAPGFGAERTRHMRLFISGSAPLLAETHQRFEARTGHRIIERYGMTETGMNTSNPYDGERRAGTVGLPLPGVEVRITEEAQTLPEGETGQIEVRGPNVFKGYWQMPDKTASELSPAGWFATGDLGRIGADGYLEIVGRAKDLIISGGYNVYPKEVEALIDATPGVCESAVIGVPHPDLGEAVVALVVSDGGGLDLKALEAALAQRLANYKRPKRVIIADELPRNTMGKVQKAELRQAHEALFLPAG